MATVTHVRALDHVANILGEDLEILEEILSNDDNLTYGAIVTVQTGTDEWITALTDDGIDELRDMLAEARKSPESWSRFLDDFVADPEIIARVKRRSPR